jgi:L-amino acid N-acyltransferase YncA
MGILRRFFARNIQEMLAIAEPLCFTDLDKFRSKTSSTVTNETSSAGIMSPRPEVPVVGRKGVSGNTHFVREASIADVPRLCAIWLEGAALAFGEAIGDSLSDEDVEKQIRTLVLRQTDNFKFWVCQTPSDEIIGWCTIQPFHTTPFARIRNAYGLISAYMSNSWRNKGVGQVFVQFAVDYCKLHTTVSFVFGFQDRSNASSVAVFEKIGFNVFGNLPRLPSFSPIAMIVCTTDSNTCR